MPPGLQTIKFHLDSALNRKRHPRRILKIFATLLCRHQQSLLNDLRRGRPFGFKGQLEVGGAACEGKVPYFFDSVGEESLGNARDSVRTKAAWR